MMWITTKPFRYRGVSYKVGDEAPADRWPNRKALMALRRIKLVSEAPAELVVEEATDTGTVELKTMKRAELNAYALSIGIINPEAYPNREALLAMLEGLGVEEDESTETAEGEGSEGSEDNDDPFAVPA